MVFHLAGLRRAPERKAFFRVNAEGTRAVCDAMLRSGARRLVLAGSLAAVGPSEPGRPHVETDPFAPREWYGESKAEAERIALASGLEVSVARPPRILGPGDRENLVFFRLANHGIRLRIGGGPRPLSVVDVDDVVELLLLQSTRPEAVGEAFFAPGPETTTLEEIQDLRSERSGAPAEDGPPRAGSAPGPGHARRRGEPAHRAPPPAEPEAGRPAPRAGLDLQRREGPDAPGLIPAHRGRFLDCAECRVVSGPGLGMNAKAAFYDVDGTLVRTNIVHAYAYYAMNRGSLTGIAGRTLAHPGSVPRLRRAGPGQPEGLQRVLLPGYYAGLSEDRLVVLAEELFEDVIKPTIFPGART